MDTMEVIALYISVLGALASFYGAYISINAKNQAKSAAEQAEFVKNQVLKGQKTTKLAEILYQAKKIQQVFGKYAITQNKSLIGAEFKKDAEALQAYIFIFNENRALVEDTTEIETESTYKTLNDLLEEFTIHRAANDKKRFGKQIRLTIDDIIFKLKKIIENRNSESD